jgi:hypothetical protein
VREPTACYRGLCWDGEAWDAGMVEGGGGGEMELQDNRLSLGRNDVFCCVGSMVLTSERAVTQGAAVSRERAAAC